VFFAIFFSHGYFSIYDFTLINCSIKFCMSYSLIETCVVYDSAIPTSYFTSTLGVVTPVKSLGVKIAD